MFPAADINQPLASGHREVKMSYYLRAVATNSGGSRTGVQLAKEASMESPNKILSKKRSIKRIGHGEIEENDVKER